MFDTLITIGLVVISSICFAIGGAVGYGVAKIKFQPKKRK